MMMVFCDSKGYHIFPIFLYFIVLSEVVCACISGHWIQNCDGSQFCEEIPATFNKLIT